MRRNFFLISGERTVSSEVLYQKRAVAMTAILFGVAMAILDASMINVALPQISDRLNISDADSIFIVSAYQISMVASLLVFSALGDVVGYKIVYVLGAITFSVSSLACSVTSSFDLLVLARAVQGLGGSAMAGVNIAIIRQLYPASLFGRAVGTSALVVALSFCSGPLISSLILSYGNWSSIFFLNFLIGTAVSLMSAIFLPKKTYTYPGRILWKDFFVVMAGLFFMAFSLSALGVSGYGSARFLASGLACLLGLAIITYNPHAISRFLPNPYDKKIFLIAIFITLFGYMAQGTVLISLPFFFLEASKDTLSVTVGVLVLWSLFSGFFAYLSGRYSDGSNPVIFLATGLFIMSIGVILLALHGARESTLTVLLCAALAGSGFGIFQTPNLKLILSYSPTQESGRSNGVLATIRLLGQMTGGVVAAACLSFGSGQGARWALLGGALCSFIAFGLASFQEIVRK